MPAVPRHVQSRNPKLKKSSKSQSFFSGVMEIHIADKNEAGMPLFKSSQISD